MIEVLGAFLRALGLIQACLGLSLIFNVLLACVLLVKLLMLVFVSCSAHTSRLSSLLEETFIFVVSAIVLLIAVILHWLVVHILVRVSSLINLLWGVGVNVVAVVVLEITFVCTFKVVDKVLHLLHLRLGLNSSWGFYDCFLAYAQVLQDGLNLFLSLLTFIGWDFLTFFVVGLGIKNLLRIVFGVFLIFSIVVVSVIFVDKVSLVAHKSNFDIFVRKLTDFAEPVSQINVRLIVGHVIYQEGTHSKSVVSGCDSQEFIIAWGIPDLSFDFLSAVGQLLSFKQELNSTGWLWSWLVVASSTSQQEVSFTHTGISDDDQLVKVVKCLGWIVKCIWLSTSSWAVLLDRIWSDS